MSESCEGTRGKAAGGAGAACAPGRARCVDGRSPRTTVGVVGLFSSKEKDTLLQELDKLEAMEQRLPRESEDTPEMQAHYGSVLGQTRLCLMLLDSFEAGTPRRRRAKRIAEWKPVRDTLLHKEFVYEALSGAQPASDT